MSSFARFSSRVIRIPLKDIDTDIIIPAEFLKTTTKEGLGKQVFKNLRGEGKNFPLDRAEFSGARIVVAGANFGCGSSREHAPWALKDAGIEVIISSEFADIFKGNAEKNGLLPILLPEETVQKLLNPADELEELTIDLEKQVVENASGESYHFEISSFSKRRFLENISDLDYILSFQNEIKGFEAKRKENLFL
ncbi:MAG: 3-isopropylmalate dehydratase small subunit [Candidatus Peregrinibacteria bacterium]